MVEVTNSMMDAGTQAWNDNYHLFDEDDFVPAIFRAMFAAMPKPNAPEVTPAMIMAGRLAEINHSVAEDVHRLEIAYRAMRLARPLSDGAGA